MEVILVLAPSHLGHKVDTVAVVFPGGNAVREGGDDAAADGDVGAGISLRAPGFGSLEASALRALERILGKCHGRILCANR